MKFTAANLEFIKPVPGTIDRIDVLTTLLFTFSMKLWWLLKVSYPSLLSKLAE